jgi:predicted dehydrogenase
MKTQLHWGILGTGNIADQFASDLQFVQDSELIAVGSRTQNNADAFADRFDIPRRYDSYQALVQDTDIDVVYIATPHTLHMENTLLCLQSGKHVLCEKPLGINAKQVNQMHACARKNAVFLMEALWTRFFPLMSVLHELIDSDEIGDLMMLMADFGFQAHYHPENRVFNPKLAGGSLLDVGIYPVSLALQLFGTPQKIASLSTIGKTGIDEQAGMLLQFQENQIAMLSSSICVETNQDAIIFGRKGKIKIHSPWYKPDTITIFHEDKSERTITSPVPGYGYHYEANEVVRCILNNQTESEIMPLSETLRIIELLDQFRSEWGLQYPCEQNQ